MLCINTTYSVVSMDILFKYYRTPLHASLVNLLGDTSARVLLAIAYIFIEMSNGVGRRRNCEAAGHSRRMIVTDYSELMIYLSYFPRAKPGGSKNSSFNMEYIKRNDIVSASVS